MKEEDGGDKRDGKDDDDKGITTKVEDRISNRIII